MPDLDLLELLSADHRNLATVETGTVVAVATQHLTVERELLYPHPHLPDHGPIGEIAEELAGVADRLRDKLHGGHRE